jgi:hypothetical protein
MDRKWIGENPSRFTNETLGLSQQLKITLNENGQKRNWKSLRLTNDTIRYIATTFKLHWKEMDKTKFGKKTSRFIDGMIGNIAQP